MNEKEDNSSNNNKVNNINNHILNNSNILNDDKNGDNIFNPNNTKFPAFFHPPFSPSSTPFIPSPFFWPEAGIFDSYYLIKITATITKF